MADDEILSFLDEADGGDKTVKEMVEETDTEALVLDETPKADAPKEALADEVETSTGEDKAAPPVAEPETQKHAPIAALTDERSKRQDAERKLQEMQMMLDQMSRNQPAPKAPDVFDDPNGAMAHAMQPLQAQMVSEKLNQSRFYAEQQFGKDVVDEAFAYFNQHPQESEALMQHPSPFHAAVAHYKQQTVIADMGSDPDAYINGLVEAKLQERLAVSQTPAPKAPPPSMAKSTANGTQNEIVGTAFDELFTG